MSLITHITLPSFPPILSLSLLNTDTFLLYKIMKEQYTPHKIENLIARCYWNRGKVVFVFVKLKDSVNSHRCIFRINSSYKLLIMSFYKSDEKKHKYGRILTALYAYYKLPLEIHISPPFIILLRISMTSP